MTSERDRNPLASRGSGGRGPVLILALGTLMALMSLVGAARRKAPDGSQAVEAAAVETPPPTAKRPPADVRDWIPVPEGVETVGTFSTKTDDSDVGGFRYTTAQANDEIVAFYRESMGDDFEFEASGMETPDGPRRQIVARTPDRSRVLHIMINPHRGMNQVHLQFQEKR